ncbi:hypothetical protein FPOA_12627 [Fusarium poae]|uniref:Uncharacterized protein n=1 Tax=Fusarium poae TaxID=36050 RepID=A0A1B8A4H4_FUSPO|nr:hypothetical protein FPOA_13818 [Fusarium poae]OBS16782.1 hypothetical protein FPOA_12625 [Fusarium poae]OBS16785.1 hypothetical protein FPOA_12627 [Fusarium poae]
MYFYRELLNTHECDRIRFISTMNNIVRSNTTKRVEPLLASHHCLGQVCSSQGLIFTYSSLTSIARLGQDGGVILR